MRDQQLYEHLLDIQSPWKVDRVEINDTSLEIIVHLELEENARLRCPKCNRVCPGYDRRKNTWRHLDTCEYKTLLTGRVPRVECPEHGVEMVNVPWAEGRTKYTMKFESLVIGWLQETSISAVERRLRLNWKTINTIQQRAVARGLARRAVQYPEHLSIDETSFQKHHEYVTVVTDQSTGAVLWVGEDRKAASLNAFFASLDADQLFRIRTVSLDMWAPFIASIRENLPDAMSKICFDRFHVQQIISRALDQVRRAEHRIMLLEGESVLTGTKYVWLRNPEHMPRSEKQLMASIQHYATKTSRAWRLVQIAAGMWEFIRRGWAERAWKSWIRKANASRLAPMKKAAATIKKHMYGIVNAVIHGVNNGHAESANSKIQLVKSRARGYRTKERLITAIYFYCGMLDLLPRNQEFAFN